MDFEFDWKLKLNEFWNVSKKKNNSALYPGKFSYGLRECFWDAEWTIKLLDELQANIAPAYIEVPVEYVIPSRIDPEELVNYAPKRIVRKPIERNVDDLLRANSKKPPLISEDTLYDFDLNTINSYIKPKPKAIRQEKLQINEYQPLPSIVSRKSCNDFNFMLIKDATPSETGSKHQEIDLKPTQTELDVTTNLL